jgi:hypothetical protein
LALSFAIKRGIAMLGGSGLAVGSAEGEGDGLGVADFLPPKSPACAEGVVAATPSAKLTAIIAISAVCFKRIIL